MTLEGAIANAEDLERIQRLADEGHFAAWFPTYSRNAALGYLLRIWLLTVRHYFVAYPGPTVTE